VTDAAPSALEVRGDRSESGGRKRRRPDCGLISVSALFLTPEPTPGSMRRQFAATLRRRVRLNPSLDDADQSDGVAESADIAGDVGSNIELDLEPLATDDSDGSDGEVGPDDESGDPDHIGSTRSRADLLEREGEVAADYLEGLLDIVDADGDIDMDVEGQRAVVSIVGERLRHLVGPGGSVLDALQELTRLAVARETGVRSRLMLDVGGHRARRRIELTELGTKAAEEALAAGEPVRLAPMTAFERKVVHDAVAAAGLRSESEGVDPGRFVVVLPDAAPRRDEQPLSAESASATSVS
jgi:spoIIIJ-associated protein